MSAHTPGPWSLDPPLGNGSFDVRASSSITVPYADGSIPAIAKVWDYALGLKQGVRGSIAEGSAEANARLIAAAPDLLAALRGAADGLDSAIAVLVCPASSNEPDEECLNNHSCPACDDYVDRNGMTRRALIARVRDARAAIAKAVGK